MTLAQRMKTGLKKMVPAKKINYTAAPEKKKVLIEVKKTPQKATIKQYGDKGYSPVSKSVTKKK